jgi:hypothetical protein
MIYGVIRLSGLKLRDLIRFGDFEICKFCFVNCRLHLGESSFAMAFIFVKTVAFIAVDKRFRAADDNESFLGMFVNGVTFQDFDV